MRSFVERILAWDFCDEVGAFQDGGRDRPGAAAARRADELMQTSASAVTFSSASDYQRAFLPAMLLEFRAALSADFDEARRVIRQRSSSANGHVVDPSSFSCRLADGAAPEPYRGRECSTDPLRRVTVLCSLAVTMEGAPLTPRRGDLLLLHRRKDFLSYVCMHDRSAASTPLMAEAHTLAFVDSARMIEKGRVSAMLRRSEGGAPRVTAEGGDWYMLSIVLKSPSESTADTPLARFWRRSTLGSFHASRVANATPFLREARALVAAPRSLLFDRMGMLGTAAPGSVARVAVAGGTTITRDAVLNSSTAATATAADGALASAAASSMPKLMGVPSAVSERLLKSLNPAQRDAVAACCSAGTNDMKASASATQGALTVASQRPVFVHGPPGTGKTSVVAALVAALVCRLSRMSDDAPPPVLLCCQSNCAVDEVLNRLLTRKYPCWVKLPNKTGKIEMRSLSCVRIARGAQSGERDREIPPAVRKVEISAGGGDGEDGDDDKWNRVEVIGATLSGAGSDAMLRRFGPASRAQHVHGGFAPSAQFGRWLDLDADPAIAGRVTRETFGASRYPTTASKSTLGSPSGYVGALVIDEGSQATEVGCLTPLSLLLSSNQMAHVPRISIFGDPHQLPCTVLAEEKCARQRLSTSLMERAFALPADRAYRVSFLDTQYRMAPGISSFVSRQFYGGELRDAASVLERASARPGSFLLDGRLKPVAFFDVPTAQESSTSRDDGFSAMNVDEAAAIAQMLAKWCSCQPSKPKEPLAVLILTPYRAQMAVLRRALHRHRLVVGAWDSVGGMAHAAETPPAMFEICTIDGAQGREADVVVLSTVIRRNRQISGVPTIGFLSEPRRACVALSRAKDALWVFGDRRCLQKCKLWSKWLAEAACDLNVREVFGGGVQQQHLHQFSGGAQHRHRR